MSVSPVALPSELWDAILDQLHGDPDALRVAALVSRSWVRTSRYHLFEVLALVFSPLPGESEKCALRAAQLEALLASPCATISAAVRKLALPDTLTPIQLHHAETGAVGLTTLLALVPRIAQLVHVRSLALSDLPWQLLSAGTFSNVEHLVLSRVCIGSNLLRIVTTFPRLAALELDGVSAIPFRHARNAPVAIAKCLRGISIRGSSITFLGWLTLVAPQVTTLSIHGVVSYELDHLAAYLTSIGAQLQSLDVSFFGTVVDERALPLLLAPCTDLKNLRLHLIDSNDLRRFFTFGGVGPWPLDMQMHITVAAGPVTSVEDICQNARVNVSVSSSET